MNQDVQAWIARANKAMGDGTFILASELVIPSRFTSGSLGLDVILGGGFPANQWVEVLGKSSAGKTAMIFKTIAANQALNPDFWTYWVCGEHFDPDQAAALGVDLDRVVLLPFGQEMEVAFQSMLDAAESKTFDCIVLDSYPALLPEEEDEKAMNEATVAKGAQLMGKFVRKGGKATRRATDGTDKPMLGIIVNQWRDKIGGFSRFGTPQTSPGGNAKDYFFYVRIDLARVEWITEKRVGIKEPVVVGQKIKFKTIKNKSASPQQTHEVDFYSRGAPTLGFARGDYDLAAEYFEVGKMFRVIAQGGGGIYTFADYKWKGEEKVKTALRSEPELLAAVRKDVLALAANPKALDELAA